MMLTYPGVYVQEAEGPRTIPGISTSVTAFVGFLKNGPVDEPTEVRSFADFQRIFGDLDADCETTFAVHQYFANGGSIAQIVRLRCTAKEAECKPHGNDPQAVIKAAHHGKAGKNLFLEVAPTATPDKADVTVYDCKRHPRDESWSLVRSFKIPGVERNLGALKEALKRRTGALVKVDSTDNRLLNYTGFVGLEIKQKSLDALAGKKLGVLGVIVAGRLENKGGNDFKSVKAAIETDPVLQAYDVVPGPDENTGLLVARKSGLESWKGKCSPGASSNSVEGSHASVVANHIIGKTKVIIKWPLANNEKATLTVKFAKSNNVAGSVTDILSVIRTTKIENKDGKIQCDNTDIVFDETSKGFVYNNVIVQIHGVTGKASLATSAFKHINLGDALVYQSGNDIHFFLGEEMVGGTIQVGENGTPQPLQKALKLGELTNNAYELARTFKIDGNTNSVQDVVLSIRAMLRNGGLPCLGKADVTAAGDRLRIALADPKYAKITIRFMEDADGVSSGENAATLLGLVGGAVNAQCQYHGFEDGDDGSFPNDTKSYTGAEGDKTGLYALEKLDAFNLLCFPDLIRLPRDAALGVVVEAAAYCKKRFAFLLVDPPKDVDTVGEAEKWVEVLTGKANANAAAYFPVPVVPDPTQAGCSRPVAPSGIMAGICAATDARRGIWKAPAGVDSPLRTVQGLSRTLSDDENGRLNPKGLNVLRSFPLYGVVPWGARTLHGDDQLSDQQWKYVPVRRLALHIESSLQRGLKWAVFEPNGEMLWAQIRLTVGAFMQELFRQGAFAGTTPSQAYFVLCDRTTTSPHDRDRGICNVRVGFAPLKPAEFVVLTIEQITAGA